MTHFGKTLSRALHLVLIGTAAVFAGTPARGQAPINLETISKAWQARQDRIKSGHFAWVERKTIVAGFLSNMQAYDPTLRAEPGATARSVIPPQDVTFDVSSLFLLDGEKTYFSNDDRGWSPKEQAYVQSPNIIAYNGKTGTWFHPAGFPTGPWPQAVIKANNEVKMHNVLPFLMAFRPLVANLRFFDLETFGSTGQTALIGGHACSELRYDRGTFIRRVWVDPSREYVIARILDTGQEQIQNKIDIQYRKDPMYGWVPETWDIVTFLPPGKLAITIRASVNKCEINANVPAKEFDIEFPVGTRVLDLTDPKGETNYILKEGGRKRMILKEDIGATYEQQLNSEPGEARGKRVQSRASWLPLVLVAVAAIAGSLLLWRRWRVMKGSR
jgi:hypothetical protein